MGRDRIQRMSLKAIYRSLVPTNLSGIASARQYCEQLWKVRLPLEMLSATLHSLHIHCERDNGKNDVVSGPQQLWVRGGPECGASRSGGVRG